MQPAPRSAHAPVQCRRPMLSASARIDACGARGTSLAFAMRHEDRAEDSRLALAAAGRRLTIGRGSPADRAPADVRAQCVSASARCCLPGAWRPAGPRPRPLSRPPVRPVGPCRVRRPIGRPDIAPGRQRSRGGRRRSQARAGVSWGGDRVQAAADRDDADRARRQPHAGGAGAGAAADVLAAPHAGVRRPRAGGRRAATAGGRASGSAPTAPR